MRTARNLARLTLIVWAVLLSLVLTSSSAIACTLRYAADGGLDPCGSTAPALGLVALGTGVGLALVATAAISLASAANMEMGLVTSPVLAQAVAEMLAELDAQALAGAQRQLQATAASMGLPVAAFTPGPTAEVPFTPTTESLVESLQGSAGIRAEYFRQLALSRASAGYQTVAQHVQNLAVPQARAGRAAAGARSQTRARLENSLTAGYLREGAAPVEAKARAASEARAVMSQLAVLHLPDLVAGGYDTPITLGLRSVNSSIGSQLRPDRVGAALWTYVEAIPPQLRSTTLVNLIFRLHLR